MAVRGLFGVYYKKCTKLNGVVTGYEGEVKMMGKAIQADFTGTEPSDNPLYANNTVQENDVSTGSGGELKLTLDRMTLDTAADLYGTTIKEVTVTPNGGELTNGKEIQYMGTEVSAPVGTAYIKLCQEDGVQSHEVMFYREATLSRPSDTARTMGESIEWQTPEITAKISGLQGDGKNPWYRVSRWPSQEAAIAYIYTLFGEEPPAAAAVAAQVQALNAEV